MKGHYRICKTLEKHAGKGDAASARGDHKGAVGHWRAAMASDAGHQAFVAPTCVKVLATISSSGVAL